jgi:hypothetical protein
MIIKENYERKELLTLQDKRSKEINNYYENFLFFEKKEIKLIHQWKMQKRNINILKS